MRMFRTILGVLCFLSSPLAAFAQTPPAAVPPASSQSLAEALATASVPSQRIYLTAAAENVTVPQDAPALPTSGSTLTTITDTYQRSIRAFGAVTAIAPPTMFVLKIPSGKPDLYAELQPEQALCLLVASLSDSQWQALIGEGGLGLSDLTDQDQRSFFQAIFSDGSLRVSVPHPKTYNDFLDLSRGIPQVRLRLSESVQISMPIQGEPNGLMHVGFDDNMSYHWMQGVVEGDLLRGLSPSADVPNTLKPGQLDWSLPVLRTPIPLAGLKTVADLIGRVAQRTQLELYVDKRYEGKSLTILGAGNGSAPAVDLMQAVAYCVTGAFRQVGPTYVLTDDVTGLAVRRTLLTRFGKEAKLQLQKQMNKAANVLRTKRSLTELDGLDDPLAINPGERAKISRDSNGLSSSENLILPLNQLTASQQKNVQQQADRLAQTDRDNPGGSHSIPDLSGKMQLQIQPRLELLVPSLTSPVISNLSLSNTVTVSPGLMRIPPKEPGSKTLASPISLPSVMMLKSRRAVLVQPKTTAELAAQIAQMKRLGFNELWLDVFSQGRPQTVLPDGSDLLTQALHRTRGTGIRVFGVIDLFQWGTDAPPEVVDCDVLGETSAQAKAEIQQEVSAEANTFGLTAPDILGMPGLSVIPSAPEVSGRLIALVKRLAQRPGLTGLVFRQTAPGGYDNERDLTYVADQPDLGYALAVRLAFLRQEHTDPLDISKSRIMGLQGGGSTGMDGVMVSHNLGINSVPGTDIPYFNSPQQDSQLSIAWDKFRRDADLTVMQVLYTTAKTSNPGLSLFVQQRHSDFSQDWYGSWDSRTAALPEWQVPSSGPGRTEGEDHVAKKQSSLALLGLGPDDVHDLSELASALSDNLKDTTWDGFVWDVTQLKPDPLR